MSVEYRRVVVRPSPTWIVVVMTEGVELSWMMDPGYWKVDVNVIGIAPNLASCIYATHLGELVVCYLPEGKQCARAMVEAMRFMGRPVREFPFRRRAPILPFHREPSLDDPRLFMELLTQENVGVFNRERQTTG